MLANMYLNNFNKFINLSNYILNSIKKLNALFIILFPNKTLPNNAKKNSLSIYLPI